MKQTIRRIVLIGFRGTGKSTIGVALAEQQQWPLISTDVLIEKRLRMPIAKFVSRRGWKPFRAIERAVIEELRNAEKTVIDCGGGVVEDSRNMEHLRFRALVVWVDAALDDIFGRLEAAGDRPLLNQPDLRKDIEANYRRREPLYRLYGNLHVNTSTGTVAAICAEIRRQLA